MIKKTFIFLCAFIFASSVLLYGEVSNAKYQKKLQMGVDENGQTVKESIIIFDEPKKDEDASSEKVDNDYIYVNPYYNGYYPNYYIPTYYPNYYNGYGGHSYYGAAPMVYTYSLTGIKYGPDGRVINPSTYYNPPPLPPRPIPPGPHHNRPPQGPAGHHNGGFHPNRH